jgi:hypothetical protein
MLIIAIYQEIIELEQGHINLTFSIKQKIFKLQLSNECLDGQSSPFINIVGQRRHPLAARSLRFVCGITR